MVVDPVVAEPVDVRPSRSVWPLLAVIVGLAGVFVGLWAWRHDGPELIPDPPAVASSAAPEFAVHDLTLADGGGTLTVHWAALPVGVVIALSRAGEPPAVVDTVPPGTTEYVVHDVDPKAAYCVVLGPVDEAVSVTAATSVCTGDR
jgi:hypothetical protein